MPHLGRASLRRVWLLGVVVMSLAGPSRALLLDHEYIEAYTQLGRLRMLSERISKQNLLYQLHLADQHKLELFETVQMMNEALGMLRAGNPLIGVPLPPTEEIARQIEAIGAAWAPLETITLSSPYEYLRRSREFISPKNRRGDPLLILHFDEMAQALLAEVETGLSLYVASCKADGYMRCELGHAAQLSETRAERLVKEAVMVYSGMDVAQNLERIAATRAALEEVILQSGDSQLMQEAKAVLAEAKDPTKTSQAGPIAQIGAGIRSTWRRLDSEIALIEKGHAEEANLRNALTLQQLMVSDLQRFSVAIQQTTTAGTLR